VVCAVVVAAILAGRGDPEPEPGTANLWVDTNGGTCTREATAGAHIDPQGCATFDAAWDAATSAMHAVRVRAAAGERSLVLRRMFREPWKTHAVGLLEREAAILGLLEATAIPVPALVAVDARAVATDEPALLMSRLPGRLRLHAVAHVEALGRMLASIHRFVPGAPDRPRTYQSWAVPERRVVPAWAREPGVWRRAFSRIDVEPPGYRGCFLHRDFHPGNVLFDGAAVSGVVDWVETSWGPADLDVAHCCTALALLHGPGTTEAMLARYLAAGGQLATDPAERAYWELVDAVGYLPDPEKVARPWRESGRPDLSAAVARDRLEAHVAAIVARTA
jgi:aminoglycoside phosphotransferase (APT) family kinase protein